jgi:hypothetical protein
MGVNPSGGGPGKSPSPLVGGGPGGPLVRLAQLFPPMSLCREDGAFPCQSAHNLSSQAWCKKNIGSPGLEMGFIIYQVGENGSVCVRQEAKRQGR